MKTALEVTNNKIKLRKRKRRMNPAEKLYRTITKTGIHGMTTEEMIMKTKMPIWKVRKALGLLKLERTVFRSEILRNRKAVFFATSTVCAIMHLEEK